MTGAKLKVVVVDGNDRVSVGASYWRAFRNLGHAAYFLDNAPWLGGWNPAIAARVARRLARPMAGPAYNAYVLAQVARIRPDILFVMKGTALWYRTIREARRWARACVVFQNDDAMNPRSTTEEMLRTIPLWDVVFTPRAFAVDELRTMGARHVEELRFAYDPSLFFPPATSEREPSLAQTAVFVGTGLPERVSVLEELARHVPVAVFGNGWNPSQGSPLRSLVRPPVFEERLRSIYASAGVNVAFVAKANRDEHTMRTFEIPAAGGFMLAERTPVHTEIYGEGAEAAFFSSTEELVGKAKQYLLDGEGRLAVAERGRLRVDRRERYEDRAVRVVDVVRAQALCAGERRTTIS